MYQGIMLTVNIIILGGIFYLHGYKNKKQVEYQDDERWQAIQDKAIKISYVYNDFLLVLVAFGSFITLLANLDIALSLSRVLMFATIALLSRNLIELIALHYYDSRI